MPPLAINLITNALYKHYTNNSKYSINLANQPLPRNISEIINDLSKQEIVSYSLMSALTFGLSFLISSFGIFLIKERISGAKHLQYLNGCNPYLFWISAFCWDMLNYLIPAVLVIAILFVNLKKKIYILIILT